MSALKDLTGQRFGRWTVIEKTARPPYTTGTAAFYRCRCDCGTQKVINSRSLIVGDSTSCGCYRNEICRERMLRINREKRRMKYDSD